MTTINWSGYNWSVRNMGSSGPGPNVWSQNNVSIDTQGNLHLKITNVGGTWYCAEVDSVAKMGYGTYTTKLVSNPETVIGSDSHIVMGIFYYLSTYAELDCVEYSRWNVSSNDNLGTLTVHSNPTATTPHFHINAANTTSKMVWHSNGNVDFLVTDSSGIVLGQWNYTGGWNTATGGTFDINLWLIGGNAPTSGTQEMVLSSFSYVPEGSAQTLGSVSPPNTTIISGKTQQFTALDTNGNPILSGVVWATTGGTVSNSGLYTSPTVTTSTNFSITATYNSVQKNATATVNPSAPQQLSSIGISPISINVNIGGSTQLLSVCKDANNNTMTCPTLIWTSSNTSIATVDNTGSVKGIATGNVTITASSGTIKSNASNLVVSTSPPTTELLLNTGFETVDPTNPSMPANWKTYNSGRIPPNPYIYVTPGRDGTSKCASIKFPQQYSGNAAWIQNIKVTAGSSYVLSAYMKTNNVVASSTDGAKIQLDWFNGSTWITWTDIKIVTGTTDWTQYIGNAVAPANATNANVVLRLSNASGQVWFDDISFKSKAVQ